MFPVVSRLYPHLLLARFLHNLSRVKVKLRAQKIRPDEDKFVRA